MTRKSLIWAAALTSGMMLGCNSDKDKDTMSSSDRSGSDYTYRSDNARMSGSRSVPGTSTPTLTRPPNPTNHPPGPAGPGAGFPPGTGRGFVWGTGPGPGAVGAGPPGGPPAPGPPGSETPTGPTPGSYGAPANTNTN